MVRLLWGLWAALVIPAVQVALVSFVHPPVTVPMVIHKVVSHFQSAGESNQYHWVGLTNVPAAFIAGVWVMEDCRFFDHSGFDWQQIRIAREEARASGKPPRGASTITQQCARSLFLWQGRSWVRKGMEAYYTVLIEALLSKHRILELYVNVIELGNGVYGVDAAARKFYGVPASQLSDEQAAMLVAILPNPRQWDPLQPNERVSKRQALVLERLKTTRLPMDFTP